jgi:hypothetical protein
MLRGDPMDSPPEPTPQQTPPRPTNGQLASVVEDGILTGIAGAAVVAVWFLIIDTARGKIFFTPSLLGSVLFLGQSPDQVISVNSFVVFAYTGLHGVLFLLAGLVLAWMFAMFERNPQFGTVLLLLFLLFESLLFSFEAGIFPNLMGAMGTLAVASGNLFAAVTMFWFLLRRHPSALARLRDAWHEE